MKKFSKEKLVFCTVSYLIEDFSPSIKQGKQSISLEPGGQFELSGAPLETLHQTCAEVNSHLYQVIGHTILTLSVFVFTSYPLLRVMDLFWYISFESLILATQLQVTFFVVSAVKSTNTFCS